MKEITEAYIQSLPKAEIHVHLEGSVFPETLLRLGKKHKTELAGMDLEKLREKFFEYEDFYNFLETYKLVCQHLRSLEDYLDILRDLGEYFQRENILYAEVIYTPSIPWKFGKDGAEILAALLEESAKFEKTHGVRIRWILDCVRQFGREVAERTAELAWQSRAQGVVGVGLGGDEKAGSLSEYEEVFNWVRAHELFVHVHAGEIGEPSEIWDALQILGANRIGHGIQASRDSKLMAYLRDHAIGLDICLTSNAKTKAWPLISEHPFPLLFERGVPVTLNTDDPGLFEVNLGTEYKKAVDTFELQEEDLHRIILQGIRSSFLPHDEKMSLMQVFSDKIQASGE